MNVIASAFDRTFHAAAAGVAAVGRGVSIVFKRSSQFGAGMRYLWQRTSINFTREAGDPLANSAVVAVVGWLARNFAEAPVRVSLEDESTGELIPFRRGPDGIGRFLRLMENPNPYYPGPTLWAAVIADYVASSDAYVLKQRDALGAVIAYYWAPSTMMEPKGDEKTFLTHYEYKPNDEAIELRVEDVIHFRDGMNPDNPRKGRSPMASLVAEIFSDNEAAIFTAQLLRNLGVPGVVIAPSNTTSSSVRSADPEEMKRKLKARTSGDERGEPLVFTTPTDVKILSWSPEQMNLTGIRRLPEERISAVLGIPASVAQLGVGLEHNTFTNYGEARSAAYEEGVIPRQVAIAATLEMQALPDFVDTDAGNYEVDFDLTHVRALRSLAEATWKQTSDAAKIGLISRADFKKANGRPVDPEGRDDVYIFPGNYVIQDALADDVTYPAAKPEQAPPPAPTALPAPAPAEPAPEPGDAQAAAFSAGPVRCASCSTLLAELATAPYRFTCRKCHGVTASQSDGVAA